MDSRGQLSAEYLMAVAVLAIVALAVLASFRNSDSRASAAMEEIYMKSVAEDLASAVNGVVIMGHGSRRLLSLPATTRSGRAYNITLRNNAVLLRWGNASDYVARFATARLNATEYNTTLPDMTNMTVREVRLLPGEIIVWNENGTVYLQNCAPRCRLL